MSEVAVRYGEDPGVSYGKSGKSVQNHDLTTKKDTQPSNSSTNEALNEKFEYDPNFKGPEDGRHCTDCCCLIFYIICLCAMVGFFFYALSISMVNYLYIPTDYRGLLCGVDNNKFDLDINNSNGDSIDYTDYPYLFWIRPGPHGHTISTCVKECPKDGNFTDSYKHAFMDKYFKKGEKCYDNVNATMENRYLPDEERYGCPYNTKDLFKRCLPLDDLEAVIKGHSEWQEDLKNFINGLGSVGNAYSDIKKTWWVILIFAVIAIFLAVIWIITLRCSAGLFVWIAVIGCFVGLGFLTYIAFRYSGIYQKDGTFKFGFDDLSRNAKAFKVLFYVMIAVDVIILLLFIFLCPRIKFTIGIIKFVSTVFGEVANLFLFPLFIFLLLVIWWAICVGIAYVLYGAGKPTYDNKTDDGKYTIGTLSLKYNAAIKYGSIYHFFMTLWGTAFIMALGEMTIAGVFAAYYFADEPRDENVGRGPIIKSLARAVRYHLGSIAFGSLLIAICQFIRAVLEYIDRKTKAAQQQNCFVNFIIKCMKCCMWCFEKFIRYMNRNSYILTAIHGYGFWTGAVKAFGLIFRNAVRAATVNFVGDFMLFLGKVFVAAVSTGLSCIWFYKMKDVNYFWVPAIFVFLITFFVSGAFTSLFEMGIDACFLCVLEDEERNPPGQRHAPQDLLDCLEEPKEVAN